MDEKLIEVLKNGRIAVISTDTIYGIVGSALQPDVVERIYKLRKRSEDKPFIILVSSIDNLEKFGVKLSEKQRKFLEKNWPNPLSVVLEVADGKWEYLHRGTKTLAFRMPKDQELLKLLKETGPLVAPSANIEGEKPAETIEEAKNYFGNSVDFYVDRGVIKSEPSTLIELQKDGKWNIIRQGKYQL